MTIENTWPDTRRVGLAASLFGVIEYEPVDPTVIERVWIPFPTWADADRFARGRGITSRAIIPLMFATDIPAPTDDDGDGDSGARVRPRVPRERVSAEWTWAESGWVVTIVPGARPAEVARICASLPAVAEYAGVSGEVDGLLVFRPAPLPGGGMEEFGTLAEELLGVSVKAGSAGRWQTDGERAAFLAGQADGLDASARALSVMLGRKDASG
jgi:uncharacterized repeat protein (TIGR03917 family)